MAYAFNVFTGKFDILGMTSAEQAAYLKLDQSTPQTVSNGQPIFGQGIKITAGQDIRPSADSTTAINIAQADGTDFVTFDTTNKRVGVGCTPNFATEIKGTATSEAALSVGSPLVAGNQWTGIKFNDYGTYYGYLKFSANPRYGGGRSMVFTSRFLSPASEQEMLRFTNDGRISFFGNTYDNGRRINMITIKAKAVQTALENVATTANATTTITKSSGSTNFDVYIGVGDRVSLSSAPTVYATVMSITGENTFTTDIALGDGTSQTLNKISAPLSIVNSGDDNPMFIYSDQARFGIGVTNPQAGIHTIGTTEQLRLGYDATHYFSTTIGATGGVTFLSTLNSFTFGNGVADTDLTFNFTGTTKSGQFLWMEDEDYFKFADNVNIDTLTASQLLATDASKTLVSLAVATYPSLTEISYVKGVTSAIQTQLNNKQPLDATLTSLAAVAGVQGDLLYASGTDAWGRLAKSTTANSFLKNSGTSNNPAWSTISTSDFACPGTNTQFLYNNNGAWATTANYTYNNSTGRATFGAFHYSAVALDYILVVGQGAYDDLVGSRSYFTCRRDTGCVGIVDNANTLGYAKARGTRLDVIAGTGDTFSELNLTGSAVFEQNGSDRNRVFLVNKHTMITGETGTSSSVLHWVECYDDPDIYVPRTVRSAYEMGNDYWVGVEPAAYYGERYWDSGTSAYVYPNPCLSWYLWDSVHACNKLYIDNNRIEGWGYAYELDSLQRMFLFKEDYRGNHIFIGTGAGNEQGEDYGCSICIGRKAGWNKGYGGGNLFIGHGAGGDQTNGSADCIIGNYAGTVLDGGYNLVLGTYAGSSTALGGSSSSTSQILIGAGANYSYAGGRVIIDPYSRGNVIKTQRDALFHGTANSTTPYTQTLQLNANVSVLGLNAICDDDSGEAIFDDDTGEMVFAEAN